MEDTAVLLDLLAVLPEWIAKLNSLSTRFNDAGPPTAINPGESDQKRPPTTLQPQQQKQQSATTLIGPSPLRPSTPSAGDLNELKSATGKRQQAKLDSKPSATKAKFSAITGPEIMYDGESQQILFDAWTALNSKRGVLRKEMMQIRRKKVLTLPSAGYGYDDSDEEDMEDDESRESEEARQRRLEEERRKAEEEKLKAEKDKKRGQLLEQIDGYLDKAAKACENAAFLWLKGDGCIGHIVFINQRVMEAIERIKQELEKENPPKEVDDDEGFVEEEAEDEEELPHKKAGQRPVPDFVAPNFGEKLMLNANSVEVAG